VEEEAAERLAAAHEQARRALEVAVAMLLEALELDQEALGRELRGDLDEHPVVGGEAALCFRHDPLHFLDLADGELEIAPHLREERVERAPDAAREARVQY